MTISHTITSVRFRNFKAFKTFSISLRDFNVLVGPNNSGKSTILDAFRILSEGIRKANSKSPEFIRTYNMNERGYLIGLEDLPIATENVFTDYNDEEPAVIDFRISNGNILRLSFIQLNHCRLVCVTIRKLEINSSDFKKEFKLRIGFVQLLVPLERKE